MYKYVRSFIYSIESHFCPCVPVCLCACVVEAALIGSLTESELDRPERITAEDKLRIQSASGQSLDEVNRMLFLFKQTRIIHEWIRIK